MVELIDGTGLRTKFDRLIKFLELDLSRLCNLEFNDFESSREICQS